MSGEQQIIVPFGNVDLKIKLITSIKQNNMPVRINPETDQIEIFNPKK